MLKRSVVEPPKVDPETKEPIEKEKVVEVVVTEPLPDINGLPSIIDVKGKTIPQLQFELQVNKMAAKQKT